MKSKLKNINSNTGKFIDGNPTSGELGTIVTAEWLNGVQERVQDIFEELKNVLALANLQPDDNKITQVADAIRAYVQTFNLKIESNTRSLANVIPNSKKSNAVNSNSADTVATSAAVKIAYDKGVEAKTAADGAQRTANDGVAKAKTAQAAAEAAQRTANDGVSKATTAQNTANSAVTKADNAQQAADNANSNANGRVLKSGDTMTGMLKITGSSTTYQVNDYGWPKKIELSGDSVIGNEASVIGFNNNGTLHLGGKPNSNEFNASIDETGLWVKGDVVTKSGASLNNALMKTGGVVTGDTSFKQGDWSGIGFYNNSGRCARIESNPHSDNNMLSFIYRESNGSNINVAYLPRKNGNILLDADFTYQKIGNFEIRKYPDGTMIQTYFINQYDLKDWKEKSFNWAQAFVGVPMIFGGILTSANWSHFCSVNILKKSNHATCYYWEYEIASDNQGDVRIQFLAIGRWK